MTFLNHGLRLFFLTVLLLSAGCVSNTVLRSTDHEAQILVETLPPAPAGTQVEYEDHQWIFGTAIARVEKKGCETRFYKIHRTDDFSGRGFFLGLITEGVGFLWVGQYLPYYDLDYKCVSATKAAQP